MFKLFLIYFLHFDSYLIYVHLIESKSRKFSLQPHSPLLVRNSTRNTSTFLSSFSYDNNVHDLFITFYCVEKIICLSPEYLRERYVNRCDCTEYSFEDYANKLPVPLSFTFRFTAKSEYHNDFCFQPYCCSLFQ